MNNNVVGTNLKNYRLQKSISTEQLAQVLDMDELKILKIENGDLMPSLDELARFGKFYGKEPNDFFSNQVKDEKNRIVTQKDFLNNQANDTKNETDSKNDFSNKQYQGNLIKNNKKLGIINIILLTISLVCYFVLPCIYATDEYFTVSITLFRFIYDGSTINVISSIVMLVFYAYILVNSIILLSYPSKVENRGYYKVGKLLNMILSLIIFVASMICVLPVFTIIGIVTLLLAASVATINIVFFILKIKNFEKPIKIKSKKPSGNSIIFGNSKVLNIINLIFLFLATILLCIASFCFSYKTHWVEAIVPVSSALFCVLGIFFIIFLTNTQKATSIGSIIIKIINVAISIIIATVLIILYMTTYFYRGSDLFLAMIIIPINFIIGISNLIYSIVKKKKIAESK